MRFMGYYNEYEDVYKGKQLFSDFILISSIIWVCFQILCEIFCWVAVLADFFSEIKERKNKKKNETLEKDIFRA